ncbi:hypothetical protein GSUB_16445 (plasmid) [Geoalkalibacter subterraneus]|uniref:Uncharacterized protein n=2 Tax=Geoalkalibacter subterraneus TaxID=483547 RepID=A0A0B5FWX0_9BACT|nr:hypothetical protein GSUB_16445 [Geoalkalibacter subterraneus]
MLGNIAWASLTESPTLGGSAVISWASHGDKEMAKIIMSLTGSLVITAEQDSDTDKEAPKVEEWIPILNIKDVLGSTKIERPNLSIYSCPDDDCMEKATEQMAIPTMVDRVSTMFFGESGSIGIVEKFITNQGSLSDEEMAFMEAIPIHGKRIRDLAIVSPGGARYYAKSAIETIAAELVDEFIATAIRSIRKAAHAHSYEMNTSFLKKLAEHEDKILAEIKEYRNQVVYSGALDQIYEGIRNSGEKKKLQMEPPTETKSNK